MATWKAWLLNARADPPPASTASAGMGVHSLLNAACTCDLSASMRRRPCGGLLPYSIEVVEDDGAVTAHAGLPLVVETMRALGVSQKLDDELGIRKRNAPGQSTRARTGPVAPLPNSASPVARTNSGATDAAKAESLVLLMAAGGSSLSDIDVLRADHGLCRLLGSEPVSAQILWTFLKDFDRACSVEVGSAGAA